MVPYARPVIRTRYCQLWSILSPPIRIASATVTIPSHSGDSCNVYRIAGGCTHMKMQMVPTSSAPTSPGTTDPRTLPNIIPNKMVISSQA